MSRKNFFILIISLLLVSNFVLLYFVLQKPSRGFDPDRPKNIIIEKLHFDENQTNAYQKLIEKHRKDIKENNDKILMLKKELYSNLKLNNSTEEMDSITTQIGIIQKQIEEIHYNHFLEIKALCKPEQLTYFDDLSEELIEVFNFRKDAKLKTK